MYNLLERMLTADEIVRVEDALRKAGFRLDFTIGSKTGIEIAWLVAGNAKDRRRARLAIKAALAEGRAA